MATVLVVDDEPIVREVVVRYLKREGYRTLEAGDGDRARELVDRGRPVPAPVPGDGLGSRLPLRAVIELALSVVAATLVVGFAAVLALRALPTVRLRLAGLALLAVLVPLTAVLLSGWVMFHMGADRKILAVATASATAAIAAALVLARSISNSIERVRAASAELARGELGARAPEDGPAEVADLAASFNESRPEDSARLDAGDARGARGRPCRA